MQSPQLKEATAGNVTDVLLHRQLVFTTVNRTNDIIPDTHYGSYRVMMSAANGLIRWKQFMTVSMCREPRRNNPFNELGGKT